MDLVDLYQRVQDWASKKAFSYNPYPVSVTSEILWPWPFTGSSRFLLIWWFFIQKVVETFNSEKNGVARPASSELGDVLKHMWDWA